MKILKEYPPCWKDLDEAFKLTEQGIKPYIAYGDIIYNPFDLGVTRDAYEHECTHGFQQAYDPVVANLWYQLYIADPVFRLSQEVEAYGAQYRFICGEYKDRNKRVRFLNELARMLTGPMYGNLVVHSEAQKLIKEASLTKKKGV